MTTSDLRPRTCAKCGRETRSTSGLCSTCRPKSSRRSDEAGRTRRRTTENDSPFNDSDANGRSTYHGDSIRDDI
jgi:predicted amidophosphoribosyltransferase